MRRGVYLAAILLALVAGSQVLADLAPPFPFSLLPRPRPRDYMYRYPPDFANGQTVHLTLQSTDRRQEVTLHVPSKLPDQLRAELPPEDVERQRAGLPPLHTVVVGVALALAFTWTGLRLFRSGRRPPFMLVSAIAAVGLFVGVSCFPLHVREEKRPQPAARLPDEGLSTEARIVLQEKGEDVRVVLPYDVLNKLAADPK